MALIFDGFTLSSLVVQPPLLGVYIWFICSLYAVCMQFICSSYAVHMQFVVFASHSGEVSGEHGLRVSAGARQRRVLGSNPGGSHFFDFLGTRRSE